MNDAPVAAASPDRSATRLFRVADLESAAPALPAPLASLVGREREVAAICALIRRDDVHLVTLVGPGGVGKTRLALAAAAALKDDFPDGVWFVGLAPITDPATVTAAIAQILGIRQLGDRPLAWIIHRG